ncbi:GspE/PulE family protein [Candidatus Ichthyocystis hellenicum]|uniref:GspE/PulE family protein n=1 Tax=Candidatus Ichthyocystis hellenicum TaxID=1561003 RepID=UPI000B1FF2BF|nr:GspE/PulE family protein [Candidatus Ichthyocystis hellenicum]
MDKTLIDLDALINLSKLDWEAVKSQYAGKTPNELAHIIGNLFGYNVITFDEIKAGEPDFEKIPFSQCCSKGCVPQKNPEERVILFNPFDRELINWVHYYLPNHSILIAAETDLKSYLHWCESELRMLTDIVSDSPHAADQDNYVVNLSLSSVTEDQNLTVRTLNSTLYDALSLSASDIHLECNEIGMAIRFRIDGSLVQVGFLENLEISRQIIARVKILSNLDTTEQRIPQDGRLRACIKGETVDFRVSIMPNHFGEDAVLRILDKRGFKSNQSGISLKSLGLAPEIIDIIRILGSRPYGMFLVTGPTGSGKTTTLYASLTEITNSEQKIITIEDPVEYRLKGVLQIPVNEKKGLTFAKGLRSILRHDPDIIMVGEIRDKETAQIAIQASLTGHLVLTTVHANNIFDVLSRLLHMGIDAYNLATALNGMIGQRLVKSLCPQCKQPYTPEEAELKQIGLSIDDISCPLYKSTGCSQCRGSGYRGRYALAEGIILNDHIRDLIINRAPISELKQAAKENRFLSMKTMAIKALNSGNTTIREISRVY